MVLDCGSHRGEFAIQILDINPAVNIHGFEANPELFASLPTLKNANFFQRAVAGKNEMVTFNFQEPESGSIRFSSRDSETVSVMCTTLESHCKYHKIEHINLLKLDIEGSELDVLENTASNFLANIDQITIEFHDFLCPEDLPRIRECICRLKDQGFYFFRMSFFTYGDCLFLNSQNVNLSTKYIALIFVHKYYLGFKRLSKKLVHKIIPKPQNI
jgi:FkbM family methyltransferase